jgi:hypothetical protein
MPNKQEDPGARKPDMFSMAIRIVGVALGGAIGAVQNHKSKNK